MLEHMQVCPVRHEAVSLTPGRRGWRRRGARRWLGRALGARLGRQRRRWRGPLASRRLLRRHGRRGRGALAARSLLWRGRGRRWGNLSGRRLFGRRRGRWRRGSLPCRSLFRRRRREVAEGRAAQEPDLAQERILPSQQMVSLAEVAGAGAAPLPSLALRWALQQPLRAPACPPGQERSAAVPQPPLEASAQHMQSISVDASKLRQLLRTWRCDKYPKHIATQLTCDSSCRNPRTLAWSSSDDAPWLDDGASPFRPSCRLRRTAAMSAGTLIDWPSLHVRFWRHMPIFATCQT